MPARLNFCINLPIVQILPAVIRALKTRPARLALCQELAYHVAIVSNKAMLEPLQVWI